MFVPPPNIYRPAYPHPRESAAMESRYIHGPSPNNKKTSLYKTELCCSWLNRRACRYGLKCQYAHGPGELRVVDRHPKYRTQPCRSFAITGHCQYGYRCCFQHVPEGALPPSGPGSLKSPNKHHHYGEIMSSASSDLSSPSTNNHPSPFNNYSVSLAYNSDLMAAPALPGSIPGLSSPIPGSTTTAAAAAAAQPPPTMNSTNNALQIIAQQRQQQQQQNNINFAATTAPTSYELSPPPNYPPQHIAIEHASFNSVSDILAHHQQQQQQQQQHQIQPATPITNVQNISEPFIVNEQLQQRQQLHHHHQHPHQQQQLRLDHHNRQDQEHHQYYDMLMLDSHENALNLVTAPPKSTGISFSSAPLPPTSATSVPSSDDNTPTSATSVTTTTTGPISNATSAPINNNNSSSSNNSSNSSDTSNNSNSGSGSSLPSSTWPNSSSPTLSMDTQTTTTTNTNTASSSPPTSSNMSLLSSSCGTSPSNHSIKSLPQTDSATGNDDNNNDDSITQLCNSFDRDLNVNVKESLESDSLLQQQKQQDFNLTNVTRTTSISSC